MDIVKRKTSLKSLVQTIHQKRLCSRYLVLTSCLFISALLYNVLQFPSRIVSGGTGGIAIILEHLFDFRPAIVIFVISAALLLFSFIFLGFEKTSASIAATFLYPLFVDLTLPLANQIHFSLDDMLLVALTIGVISGITNGLCYKVGFSNGGLGILSQILYKKANISISKSAFVINAIIVIAGGIYFGWTLAMYACIVLAINSFIMDKVILGSSNSKTIYIFTAHKEQEMKDFILTYLSGGVTILEGHGGYRDKRKHVLMTVISTKDYFKLKEGMKKIDPDAFLVVIDTYESSIKSGMIPTLI